MSIVVECPHCESRFNLNPELAGKAMRCPNVDCREAFIVREVPQPAAPPPPPPPVADPDLPVLPPLPSGSSQHMPVVVVKPKAPPPAPPPEPEPEEEVIVEAALIAPPAVREVVWSADADVAGLPPATVSAQQPAQQPAARPEPTPRRKRSRREQEPEEQARSSRRRKKPKSHKRLFILVGMLLVIPLLVIGGLRYRETALAKSEEQIHTQAKTEYADGNFAAAAQTYRKLATDFPKSQYAEKYQFFADVSILRNDVSSATNRQDPTAAIQKFRTFVAEHKDSPLLLLDAEGRPEVIAAGVKVCEDIAGYAKARTEEYRKNRSTTAELDRADQIIAIGRELLTLMQNYRSPTDTALGAAEKTLDDAAQGVADERTRLVVIAGLRPRLERPTDELVDAAWRELDAHKLRNDPEASGLVRDAEAKLGRQFHYQPEQIAAKPPAEVPEAFLFVPPIGTIRQPIRGAIGDTGPGVFLAVAHDSVYALDEDKGERLWTARVGPDVLDPPVVARVDLPEGPTEVAVVVSNVGGKPGVSAYDLRTGRPRWFQPLPAPPAGPATVIGQRGFVAVKDPDGSIFEFELPSGLRVGRMTLAQLLGPATLRAGTGLLYVVADTRRIYVLDLDGRDTDGNRLLPRCVQLINTGHTPGSVRSPPVFLGPPGDAPAERWMVLSQRGGPGGMNLRLFPLPPVPPPAADGLPPPTGPAASEQEFPIPGWVSFPPTYDGERLAMVTDFGQIRFFGMKQPGNVLDKQTLFPLPEPKPMPPADGVAAPGLIIPAPDGSFWVLAGGADLRHIRLTLNPSRGQLADTFPAADPTASGVPTQPARLNDRRDTAFVVVRSADSSGFRAVAVDLLTGEARWRRQLGMVPAAAPVPTPIGLLLVEEDGAIAIVPPGTANADSGASRVIASSHDNASGPTAVAVSPDGATVFTVTPVRRDGTDRFEIRKVVGGRVERSAAVPAPGAAAGPPAAFGDSVLLPTADGSIHRLVWAGIREGGRLVQGPRWSGDRLEPGGLCFVTALGGDRFLTTDGGRNLARWVWPDGGQPQPDGRIWTVPERVAVPAVMLPASGAGSSVRVLVADVTGSIWLYSVDQDDRPVRWRPNEKEVAGAKPAAALVIQMGPNGRPIAAYVAEGGSLVCVEPDIADVRWTVRVVRTPGGVIVGPQQPAGEGRWVVTDLDGHLTVFDPETRQITAVGDVNLPGAVPAAAGVLLEPGRVLVPLSDGSPETC